MVAAHTSHQKERERERGVAYRFSGTLLQSQGDWFDHDVRHAVGKTKTSMPKWYELWRQVAPFNRGRDACGLTVLRKNSKKSMDYRSTVKNVNKQPRVY